MGKQIVEQPRGLRDEHSAMVHLRTVRSYAKVDHGRFLPFVFCTLVYKAASPQTPVRSEKPPCRPGQVQRQDTVYGLVGMGEACPKCGKGIMRAVPQVPNR